ncbi:hypothetical protein L6164_027979 [Bauhinia variegata]|uniref:Uncharacterized protein n=1 Tax=Bauhinia variegata TaxID=167791 RepID=A0ACB9LUQ0_BAUVA|nr:hypothetical protein L6164_027979 [Bauhinia variegata]
MQSTKEKLSNMASAAKEKVDIYKAKMDEKAEKAMARTEEEKVIAHERAKAKEAKAKMELHEAKAEHAADKLNAKQSHSHLYGHHRQHMVGAAQPPLVGTGHQVQNVPLAGTQSHNPTGAVPMTRATYPANPLGGNQPLNKHI